jgi:hypothetical protein
MVEVHRQQQRSVSTVGLRVDVGAISDQELRDSQTPGLGRSVQGRDTIVVARIHRRARGYQQLRDIKVFMVESREYSGATVLIFDANVCLGVEEHLDNMRMSLLRRFEQGRSPIPIPHVDIGAVRHQRLYPRHIAIARRPVQRCVQGYAPLLAPSDEGEQGQDQVCCFVLSHFQSPPGHAGYTPPAT